MGVVAEVKADKGEGCRGLSGKQGLLGSLESVVACLSDLQLGVVKVKDNPVGAGLVVAYLVVGVVEFGVLTCIISK